MKRTPRRRGTVLADERSSGLLALATREISDLVRDRGDLIAALRPFARFPFDEWLRVFEGKYPGRPHNPTIGYISKDARKCAVLATKDFERARRLIEEISAAGRRPSRRRAARRRTPSRRPPPRARAARGPRA